MYTNNELYHHGVKGMKWGVRRKQKRIQRADRKIRGAQTANQINKIVRDYRISEAKIKRSESSDRFGKIKDSCMNYKIRSANNAYSADKIRNDYIIAKAKAKKDPAYKNTQEYEDARMAGLNQMGKDFLVALLTA